MLTRITEEELNASKGDKAFIYFMRERLKKNVTPIQMQEATQKMSTI